MLRRLASDRAPFTMLFVVPNLTLLCRHSKGYVNNASGQHKYNLLKSICEQNDSGAL